MARGRPTVALIVTDDERVQLNSLAHRFDGQCSDSEGQ
jgi:hypothetical protein